MNGRSDICVSIVPSEYTSQLCCDCWTIDEENRPSQEVFKCVKCGHEDINADTHGASVIKTYVKSTVLREALLDKNPNGTGTYLPKDLAHSQFKEKILCCVSKLAKAKARNGRKDKSNKL